MRVLILGADGYLGWPTTMHLSARGHQVLAADNYLSRQLARQEDVEPLHLIPNLHERLRLWGKHSGHEVKGRIGDLRDWEFMADLVGGFQPDAVIHYAEQPSAPFSMLSRQAADLTLHNNLGVTFNLISAVRTFAPEAHIIKLGTMGEYGTPNIDIEEGWLKVEHKGREHVFLYPRQASSLYHTTKIMDTDLLWFYVRTWNLTVTDLMQGPVYGIYTKENEGNEQLVPHFRYDEIFGTVLNRFITQAVVGYPLTVYGQGSQVRGYLNIGDTLNCVALSLENPPGRGDLRIFNQFTETFSVNELAQRVKNVGDGKGFSVAISKLNNPRSEAEEHYYNPVSTGLSELGLTPNYLTDEVLGEMMDYVARYRDNISTERIFKGVKWA